MGRNKFFAVEKTLRKHGPLIGNDIIEQMKKDGYRNVPHPREFNRVEVKNHNIIVVKKVYRKTTMRDYVVEYALFGIKDRDEEE